MIIKKVLKNSLADKAGIKQGDRLIKINNEPISDEMEYRFFIVDTILDIELMKKEKSVYTVKIKNLNYDDLGLVFDEENIMHPKSCHNKCIFCFIDQLPKGLREPLYFKDDDLKLSFLKGNYVTLTNISDKEIDKIIKMRLSPINISVHTTDENLRVEMLHNKKAANLLTIIDKFKENDILMNCQIVLCSGINDGEHLIKTLTDLSAYFPYVNSISVVPVGITKYRQGLVPLSPLSKQTCENVIDTVSALAETFKQKVGSKIVFLADEFYIKAEREIPSYEEYEDFPQIENGVGLVANFTEECLKSIQRRRKSADESLPKTIITGEYSYHYLNEILKRVKEKYPTLDYNLYPIKNDFFGENITVSGLITGCDILNQLKNKKVNKQLLIPASMLRAERDMFLDNTTIKEIEKMLNTKVILVEISGKNFIDKLLK